MSWTKTHDGKTAVGYMVFHVLFLSLRAARRRWHDAPDSVKDRHLPIDQHGPLAKSIDEFEDAMAPYWADDLDLITEGLWNEKEWEDIDPKYQEVDLTEEQDNRLQTLRRRHYGTVDVVSAVHRWKDCNRTMGPNRLLLFAKNDE